MPPKNASPQIDKPSQTNFPTAIAAIRDGHRVTKMEWGDPETIGQIRDGILQLHLKKSDGSRSWFAWTVSQADMDGKDWVILPN